MKTSNETDHVDVIVDGATKYLATEDGLVKWRERPEHFRKNCAARAFPRLELEMSNLEKLPVTVITGFLGSGKTTLVRT